MSTILCGGQVTIFLQVYARTDEKHASRFIFNNNVVLCTSHLVLCITCNIHLQNIPRFIGVKENEEENERTNSATGSNKAMQW